MTAKKYTASDRLRHDFTMLPNSIIRSERLTGNAKALYAIMVDAAWRGAEPEQEELGRLLGGGKKAAAAATKVLVETGLVEVRRRGRGMTNAYSILHPSEVKKGREGTSRSAVAAQQEGPSGPNHARAREERRTTKTVEAAKAAPTEVERRKATYLAFARVCGIPAELVEDSDSSLYDRDLARELAVALASIRKKASAGSEDELSVQIQLRATLYVRRWPEIEITPSALAKHWNRVNTTPIGQRPTAREFVCPHEDCQNDYASKRALDEHIHIQHPELEETAA